jgi:hypothetical protein
MFVAIVTLTVPDCGDSVPGRSSCSCQYQGPRGPLQVSRAEMHWLGLHAFRLVLGRKQAAYRAVLAALDAQMLAPRMRALAPRLAAVVEERRSSVFSGIRY